MRKRKSRDEMKRMAASVIAVLLILIMVLGVAIPFLYGI